MDTIFDEINRALELGVYYAAVAIALSIPDICASLQHPPNTPPSGSNKSGYIRWYNANLQSLYPELTGDDFYSLRSGVVHNGRFGAGKFERVLFTLPMGGPRLHRCTISDALNIDARTFCQDVVDTARAWIATQTKDKNVQQNLERLVQFRPQGFKPYINGVPLIA